ncbi:ATP-binding protein [Bacillus wiedmannii]|uniref:ATP-binding protein n=1 Tax=Bacillus wiedmannii TaxID=1890302 RepID=UPI000BEFA976|nr:ATP-binding protein [Bacillus wiedmannii]PEO36765.1 DNA replication protein [Bacillus wiedmannii]
MKSCILRNNCSKASTCKSPCPAYIQLQGINNRGGKQGDALIPSEYKSTTLSTARSRESQTHVYADLDIYKKTFFKAFNTDRYEAIDRLKDMYFFSLETGTGKTETATALLNEFLMYSYVRSVMKEDPEVFVNPIFFLEMPKLQSLYTKANRPSTPKEEAESASREYYRLIRQAKKCRFVVLDEMGLREVSDAFSQDIYDLINKRTVENLTTIYTSNVSMDDLERVYGRRIFDRVRRWTRSYEFIGESMRGEFK